MEENLTLGEKIKKFRKRAGLSQLKLEMLIDASSGVISRIENNEINPTKETLLKIIDVLNLRSYDAASIFNLDITELPKLVKLSRKLYSDFDRERILQNAVNEIAYELKLHGVSIFLIKNDALYAQTFTNSWYTSLALKVIPVPFKNLKVSLSNKENYFVRSVNEKQSFYSTDFRKFSIGMLSKKVSDLLQKVTNTQSIIVLPIINNDEVIGTVLFAKDYIDDFKNEFEILEAFVDNIAAAIINAQKYQKLQEAFLNLKNGR